MAKGITVPRSKSTSKTGSSTISKPSKKTPVGIPTDALEGMARAQNAKTGNNVTTPKVHNKYTDIREHVLRAGGTEAQADAAAENAAYRDAMANQRTTLDSQGHNGGGATVTVKPDAVTTTPVTTTSTSTSTTSTSTTSTSSTSTTTSSSNKSGAPSKYDYIRNSILDAGGTEAVANAAAENAAYRDANMTATINSQRHSGSNVTVTTKPTTTTTSTVNTTSALSDTTPDTGTSETSKTVQFLPTTDVPDDYVTTNQHSSDYEFFYNYYLELGLSPSEAAKEAHRFDRSHGNYGAVNNDFDYEGKYDNYYYYSRTTHNSSRNGATGIGNVNLDGFSDNYNNLYDVEAYKDFISKGYSEAESRALARDALIERATNIGDTLSDRGENIDLSWRGVREVKDESYGNITGYTQEYTDKLQAQLSRNLARFDTLGVGFIDNSTSFSIENIDRAINDLGREANTTRNCLTDSYTVVRNIDECIERAKECRERNKYKDEARTAAETEIELLEEQRAEVQHNIDILNASYGKINKSINELSDMRNAAVSADELVTSLTAGLSIDQLNIHGI